MDEPFIRALTAEEVDLAVDWAAAEGWNPGLADAALFRPVDPGGFLGLFKDGVLACVISAVRYGDAFGFIGFYICRPDLRGRGLGIRIWNAALARMARRTIGLDGVVAQQANYARAGFVLAHRNVRFAGVAPHVAPVATGVVEIGPHAPDGLIDSLVRLERPFFPVPRDDFARAWIEHSGHRAAAHLTGGDVDGYGVIRPCHSGFKIGPLVAHSPASADAILTALIARHPGAPVMIDLPEPHAAAIRLAERYGLSPTFQTARMYRGEPPDLPLDRIFGLTTFELG